MIQLKCDMCGKTVKNNGYSVNAMHTCPSEAIMRKVEKSLHFDICEDCMKILKEATERVNNE